MLLLAIVCFLLAIIVLTVKRPLRPPESSKEYRVYNRVVASVLMLVGVCFIILSWVTGRYFC